MKAAIKGMTVLLALFALCLVLSENLKSAVFPENDDSGLVMQAIFDQGSNVLVEVEARVIQLHPDIEDFEIIQAFSVELANGLKVRVHHNLEHAPRVPIDVNSEVRISGEYDWNGDGGVIHWTHAAPTGDREGGWIEYQGRRFL